jgi:hypothetical protein
MALSGLPGHHHDAIYKFPETTGYLRVYPITGR